MRCSTILFAIAALALSSCSKTPPADSTAEGRPPAAEAKKAIAEKTPAEAASVIEEEFGEDFPPILRTAWKGDLDEIAKRRVLRVLLPFRTPEFFYNEGNPVGVLWEVFQEIERQLNQKYRTGAADRIVVALLPTPVDRLQERITGGFGDVAAYGILITEERRKSIDFTNPVATGLTGC